MPNDIVPPEINTLLAGERPDFIVKSKRSAPLWLIIFLLGSAFISTIIAVVFFISYRPPNLQEVLFSQPTNTQTEKLKKDAISIVGTTGFCIMAAILLFIVGLYFLLKEGAWFIGTEKKLIKYQKGKVEEYLWTLFNGKIEVKGTTELGTIVLELKEGEWISGNLGTKKFVPYRVLMIEIKNAPYITELLSKRINNLV